MKFFLLAVLLSILPLNSASADQVESLIKMIGETDQVETKLAAIQQLGDIGDDRGVPVLLDQAKLSDPQIRFSAIKSLGRIGTEQARAALREMEQAGDAEQQKAALIGLAMAKDTSAKQLAEEALRSPAWMARWYAVLALDILNDPESISLLESALTDPFQLPDGGRFPVREAAQAALDRFKSSVYWSYTFNGGLERAKVESKPILLYFFINGGEWCEQFEQESLAKESIQKLMKEFVPLRINAYSEAGLSERYGVAGTPTIIILDPQGGEISRLPGYVGSERVESYLEESLAALSDKGGSAELWIKAQGFIDQGHYQEAVSVLESFLAAPPEGSAGTKEEWARFMLALSYGKIENFHRSKELFEQFIKQFPNSELSDKALYCLALSKLHLADRDSARDTLTDLLARFPSSSVVKQAQDLLNQVLEHS
ncbi:MAG: HEAT repeat domain-containing protein [Candidatus Omnitrophica bacterium]|nr:HEAT repeat domain-containing protein [Candidatus Omnitrophota bacterium]